MNNIIFHDNPEKVKITVYSLSIFLYGPKIHNCKTPQMNKIYFIHLRLKTI